MKREAIVLGLGKSGQACARYFAKRGFSLLATDDALSEAHRAFLDAKEANVQETWTAHVHLHTPSEIEALLPTHKDQLAFVMISPGVPPTHPLVQRARSLGIETVGEVELACRELVGYAAPVCGITGSNGKTTTTLLLAHMLCEGGLRALSVGNIGKPLLDVIDREHPVPLVVELSSFQLETLSTARLDVALLLNIEPNHLDRHGSLAAYAEAKWRIASSLREGGVLFCHESVEPRRVAVPLFTYGQGGECHVQEVGGHIVMGGKQEVRCLDAFHKAHAHDKSNFLAAYAAARHLGMTPECCMRVFSSFTKPPHRLEWVAQKDGICYYNDSKACNVAAVVTAVRALNTRCILIAGGMHKGEPYHAWAQHADLIAAIFAIGEAQELIYGDVHRHIPVYRCSDLREAVLQSRRYAEAGMTILLSPGCSSFDMFRSYEERGEIFRAIVKEL